MARAKTLKEELEELGMGRFIQESEDTPEEDVEEVTTEDSSSESGSESDEESDDDTDDSEVDEEIDGEYVSESLFNRIQNLDLSLLEDEELDALKSSLSEKKIPEDASDALLESADRVAMDITEAKAKRIRRSGAHSMTKKKSFQCPEGFRQKSTGGGSPRCVPSHRAVGGSGKVAQERRKKAKWAKSGKGAKSKRLSSKWAQRREGVEVSPFASKLRELVEGTDTVVDEPIGVRDELVSRVVNIVDLMSEHFADDEAVVDVYNEALEEMLDAYEVGQLDEDVSDDKAFISGLAPVVTLIRESYRNVLEGDTLGN